MKRSPIHPDLAPLARAAKTFAREFLTKGRVTDLATVLRDAAKNTGWLRPEHRIGDPARYMRHLLYVDPDDDFVITAITWLPGQQSTVHGHYVWCAYGIAEGELTEELFRAPGALLEQVRTSVIRAGELAELDLGGPMFHRVSNRTRRPLVSLHVYGVAADRLTTGINGHVSAFVEHFFDVDVTMSQRSSDSIHEFCEHFETGFVEEKFGIFSLRSTSKFPFALPTCSTNAGTRVFN